MKVFFDHIIFSLQKYGGVSKYFAEMIKHLPENSWEIPFCFSDNEYIRNKNLFKQYNFLRETDFQGRGRILTELSKPFVYMSAKTSKFDIYHQTHFDDFLFGAVKNKRFVTTFHDINFLKNPSTSYFWKGMTDQQIKAFERADKIIAISLNTKKDLLENFHIDESKVEVIYHGIDVITTENMPSLVENPYILYVGTRHGHKNFSTLLSAFKVISKKYSDLYLVCTGRGFSDEEILEFKNLGVDQKILHFDANEKRLAQLYQHAQFFVFPSKYEGFGMPILEAMAYQCPVVLSNASCFPEIAADAGLFFDPDSAEDMANKMEKMLTDSTIRQQYIKKGLERSRLFSWQQCADEHYKLYQSLL